MFYRVVVPLLLAASFAGCVETIPDPAGTGGGAVGDGVTSVHERGSLPFAVGGDFSYTLEPGPYAILPAQSIHLDVQVPLEGGLQMQRVHLGLFLPEVPEGTPVPVVADVGPYYGDSDVAATEPANRLGRFLIENLVPHGYAVAQVSVLGTGKSEGCMDYLGPVEQAGVQQTVDWLGSQPWSNGAVALIGRSYDGTTPWQAAMAASPYLKTIVPISGLTGLHELMWRNGSAESRGPGTMWATYYTFALRGEEADPGLQARQVALQATCPDATMGPVPGVGAYVTGDHFFPAGTYEYWQQRHFLPAVLENYRGSVYFIHGLRDWNVDPHMAFPAYQELEARGIEIKGLFGQWGHNYPDRKNEHEHLRWDWAQDLLEWFDHYLKGTGAKPALHVEVQDDAGQWRVEPTWPPTDASWATFTLGSELQPQDAQPLAVAPGRTVTYRTDYLAQDLHIAGLPHLHATVTPMGAGGQLYAELVDVNRNERVGWAIMDLRYAEGGTQSRAVTPGQPLVARMEFEPLDAVVPAGHRLELRLSNTGSGYLPSPVTAPVLVEAGELRLPLVDRPPEWFFVPPAHGVEWDA